MTRRPLEIAIVVIGAVVVILLSFSGAGEKNVPPSVYSTYDTGPNGYRALYQVLRDAGAPVARFERALGALDSLVRTIVITGYEEDPSAKPLDERDAEFLKQFVENGGRLVAVDAEFAGKEDVAPGVGTSQRAR